MNMMDKIEVLKKAQEAQPIRSYLEIDVTFEESKWQPGEFEEIQKEYPFLPPSYIDFIRKYDSIGIAWVTFFGSKGAHIISLKEKLEGLKDVLNGKYFPFAKLPSGCLYAFNEKGEVLYFIREDFDFKKPTKIADTFEEFVSECILGKRYLEFNYENSLFYQFLKKQGWA